jgi:plastocyanin
MRILFRGRLFRWAPLGVVVGLGLLGLAGYAVAASFTVTLTSGGPQPGIFTAALGDTVTFVNGDSATHTVVDRQIGLQSPALGPGQSFAFVLTTSGRSTFQQEGKPDGSGQIVVLRTGTVTLKTNKRSVAYRLSATLTGTSSLPTFPVKIEHKVNGDTRWNDLGTVNPMPDGSFTLTIQPETGAQYRAAVFDDELLSPPVDVDVRPIMTLAAKRRSARGGSLLTLTARIVPADAANSMDLMRFDSQRQNWKRVLTRAVPSSGRVTFRWRLEYGRSLLRTAVVKRALARGFAEASSRPVLVRGTGTPPPRKRGRRGP